MPSVRTDLLMHGMALAGDALAPDGTVAAEAGAIVDNELLAVLASRKVRRVEVTPESFEWAAAREEADEKPRAAHALPDKRKDGTAAMDAGLVRIARMFSEHREDARMRELCRLAIKCAQERLIGV